MQSINSEPADVPPATPAPALRRRRPLYRRMLWWGLITAAILFVIISITWVSYSAWTHRQLARERQLIADAGEPLNWGAFHDRYSDRTLWSWQVEMYEGEERSGSEPTSGYAEFMEPLPAGADRYYAAAMELIMDRPGEGRSIADRILTALDREQREMTADEAVTLGDWLSERRLLFELLDEAASIPHCRYELPEDEGPRHHIISGLRYLAHALAIRARWQVHQVKVDAAIESIIAMLRVNRMFALRPYILTRFTQSTIEQSAITETRRLLSTHALSAEALRRLTEEMKALDDGDRFRRTLVAQRISSLDEVEAGGADWSVRDWYYDGDYGAEDEWLVILPPMRRHFQAAMLAEMRNALEAIERPYPEQTVLLTKLEICGSVDNYAFAEYRTLAWTRAMRAALAVELYRIDHGGRAPDSWQPLVAADLLEAPPVDPFSGEAMKLVVAEDSYTIYSLGDNGLDDGGAVTPPGGRGRPFDDGLMIRIVPRD